MSKLYKEKCFYIILILFFIICGFVWYSNKQYNSSKKLLEEIEYYDSLGNYNKVYYSKVFKELRKENKELYDSLKDYKDQIDFIVQFYHEKDYNTGQVSTKPNIIDSVVYDTIPITIPQVAKTYEYTSEPNDTFQYKLNVNSFTEPNWYSINAKVKNKFTIVNKEDGSGLNHITIEPQNGGTISDPTIFKKEKKKSLAERFVIGPSLTGGYDVVNKRWGMMAGISATFNIR